MNLGQSIRSGVKWLFVGNTGGQVLQFVFGIALARLLVPADFGMIATIQVFTGFVGVVASGGMGQSLIRAKEVETEDFNAVFTMQLGLGVLIYAGFFLTAPWIARYFENSVYTDLLRVSATSFLIRPMSFARISWLSRQMDFKRRSQIDLATGLLSGVISVVMAAIGMGVWSLVLSGLIGALVGNVLLGLVTPLRLRLNFNREAIRKHAAYGLKITAGDILRHLKDQSVNLVLSKLAGPTFLGFFNKAESLARTPNRLVTPPTGQAVFRAMSMVQDDLDRTKYMFYRTISLLMIYVFPMLIGLWWVAEQFVRVVYGEKWLPIVEPMRIIVLAGLLRTVWIPCGLVLNAQNRLTEQVVAEAIGLFISVALVVIGLKWGLTGVAWGVVLSTAFYAVYAYALVYRTLSTKLLDLLWASIPALILNALLVFTLAGGQFLVGGRAAGQPWLYLVVMVAVGATVYATAFLFLPIPALQSEAIRWKQEISRRMKISTRQGK
jgi:teichuronic acid exporter